MVSRYFILLASVILATGFVSCRSSNMANVEHGSEYNFEVGVPEFHLSAFGVIDEQQGPTLEITVEINKSSLIFKERDPLVANIALDIQVTDLENSIAIESKHLEEKITLNSNEPNSQETIEFSYSLQVTPGNYEVTGNVKDLNTQKDFTRRVETYIPKTEKGAYTLSSIQMYGKYNGQQEWDLINTYDVKGKVDSLRFVFQVISEKTDEEMLVNSKLLRFKSDTSYTRNMHSSNFSPSSIEYKGIAYNRDTKLQSNQRILSNYSSVFIEYKFKNPIRGNYRFEVTAQKGKEEKIYKGRAFGVKSKNFPAVISARELARPLVYLMDEKDHENLMNISDNDSLKKEIDKFWLKNIGDVSKARSVIRKYYQRVEEANKQFSNYKEGWKTSRGMIYILFGPPWYTRDHLKELTWYYSYNFEDTDYSYNFYQPKLNSEYYPFYHFLLRRHNYYYKVEYLQRRLWLTGEILTRDI